MGIFSRKKRQETVFRQDQIDTLANSLASRQDSNRDGIPDYLQREAIPSLVKTNKDLNIWEVDVQKEIEEWIMGLRGYEFNASENKYIPVCPPTMNDAGAKQIQTHLKSTMNKHAINTSLTLDEVHQICRNSTSTLARWLKFKAKAIEINKADLSSVLWQYDNMTFLVLTRSVDDKQRQHTTGRTRLTGTTGGQQASFPA